MFQEQRRKIKCTKNDNEVNLICITFYDGFDRKWEFYGK